MLPRDRVCERSWRPPGLCHEPVDLTGPALPGSVVSNFVSLLHGPASSSTSARCVRWTSGKYLTPPEHTLLSAGAPQVPPQDSS